jgi:putative ubiquitin-RnfH superfamily antitoxin RatB of RatAB toxin-antitoxin module
MAQCLQAAKVTDADAAQLQSLHFLQPGIWGRKVPWTHVVQAGDRIELYRPLKVDPKVARRQRFKRQGKGRTGLFANRKSGSAAGY